MVFIKLIISLIFLLWSGGILAGSLTKISRSLKLSTFVISFVLMAAATSVPELFVGIMSAFQGSSELAFGTIIGSNIADIALVLGLLLIINKKMFVQGVIRHRESLWMATIAFLPLIMAIDGMVSRIDGVILLVAFLVYFWQLIKSTHFFQKIDQVKYDGYFWLEIGKFVVAVVILLLSSHYTVYSAKEIALVYNFPVFVIGILVVALGTSLPELVFAYQSSKSNHPRLSLGDITGSIVFNASAILGIVAIIDPIILGDISKYLVSGVFLTLLLVYFVFGVHKKKLFSPIWGAILIVSYLIFAIIEFTL